MGRKNNQEELFKIRFQEREEELKNLYMELYHNDQQAYDYFCGMLFRNYRDRRPVLKKLDMKREMQPDWYHDQKLLGMMLYVDAFAGDLQGVEEHLSYLRECGVNYLHLMPLLESPKGASDGGYAVQNYRKVQPELGTMKDLVSLTDACHKNGISTCLDFVMNHTSESHEWAVAARAGDPAAQARYFLYDDWSEPNEYEKYVPQVFPKTAPGNFSWCEELGKVVMTTFHPYQWDLNYANPMVFNDMTDAMLFLCNQGVDVIRLDATPYIWKEPGTNCRNLPQVHKLTRMMHIACEIVCPGTLLLGEIVMEPARVVPYFGTVKKPECHMLYNVTTMASTWHTVATQDVRLLEDQLQSVFDLPSSYTFLNYLRCHDDIGWGLDYDFLRRFGMDEVSHKKFLNDWFLGVFPGSTSRGALYNDDPELGDARMCGTTASLSGIEAALEQLEKAGTAAEDPTESRRNQSAAAALEKGIRLDLMLHAFLLTLNGIPVIYSGDEIGQLNDNAYVLDPFKEEDSRYLHRGAFSWELAEKRNDLSTTEGKIFHGIRKLEKIRESETAFHADAKLQLVNTGHHSVLGITRSYGGKQLLALFNFSREETAVTLPKLTEMCPDTEGNWRNLITGESAGTAGPQLVSYEYMWLTADI